MHLRELELVAQRRCVTDAVLSISLPSVPSQMFDISKHISLVPLIREIEVDSYFAAFDCIATALQWPSEVWPPLLQCKIHGKAQDAVAALPVEESLSYEHVKAVILCA